MIILTGGKTGGHIIPLLALAQELENVCYIGASFSLEEKLCEQYQIPFVSLPLKNNHLFSIIGAFFRLRLPKADAVISTGGYVSFPCLLKAILHRTPIYLLEENVIVGKTNRFFSIFAKKVFLTYPVEKMKKKYEIVGLPILKRDVSNRVLHSDILVIGGSLGSKPLCKLAEELSKKYQVCLIAGRYAKEYHLKNGIVLDYAADITHLMQQSTIVISRAGASTTYELFYYQCPCVIIPSRHTKQNHQYLNALFFEKNGCCKMLKEDTPIETAIKTIEALLWDDQLRLNMKIHQKKLIIRNGKERIITKIKGEVQ